MNILENIQRKATEMIIGILRIKVWGKTRKMRLTAAVETRKIVRNTIGVSKSVNDLTISVSVKYFLEDFNLILGHSLKITKTDKWESKLENKYL